MGDVRLTEFSNAMSISTKTYIFRNVPLFNKHILLMQVKNFTQII